MAGTGGLLYASLQVAQAQFLPFGKTGNTPISPIANSQTVFSTVRILHSTYLESPSVEGLSYGRDRRIRTVGILLPKQALYQAELCPVKKLYFHNNLRYFALLVPLICQSRFFAPAKPLNNRSINAQRTIPYPK